MKWHLCATFVLVIAGFSLHAQEISPALEARMKELERRAADADLLARRVEELEGKLAAEGGTGRELETLISAKLADWTRGEAVTAARSQSLVFGGQFRLRAEYRNVGTYATANSRDTGDETVIQRTRLNVLAEPMDHIKVFLELQDSRTWGEEMGPLTDLEGVDLHQGYVVFEDFLSSGLTLLTGRYEMSLWNQRLISPMDWHPVARSFDGFVIMSDQKEDFHWQLGYNTINEDPRPSPGRDTRLIRGVLNYHGIEELKLGAAVLWRRARAAGVQISDWTATLHGEGASGGFDYSFDLVGQFGNRSGLDANAFATAVTFGYTFEGDWSPRIGIEGTWASGDDDPTDGDSETFDPLFPFGHAYQGYLDLFSWRNGHDVALHLSAKPDADWKITLSLHGFWLDTKNDAWYRADLSPVRLSPGADSKNVGYEVDLAVRHDLNDHIWIWFGYSHFFTGEFVEDSGDSPDTDWVWFQLTVGF